MKQISFKGNLPSHMRVFAKQLGGIFSQVGDTEFWEASSIAEFEKSASEIGYEIVPTIDGSTDRAFLVGFDAEDSVIVGSDGDSYSKLKMYFIEITPEELKAWDRKIKAHRAMQEQDMRAREELSRQAHKKRKKLQQIVNEQIKKK
jgi:hypothetical protein